MAETNEFYIKIGADVNDATTKLNQLSSQLSQLAGVTQNTSNKISGSMNNVGKSINSVLSGIGISLGVASIVSFGKSALTTAAQLEQTAVAFRVFTGSASTANQMLAELKAQALNSPMQFQDITKGAQTLLQYGLTARQTTEITRMLGDISAGNADKFQRLSLAFGQVNAAGRLMGQEARQMINAGFNPLQAISDKTGQSMAVLTQRMHDGQISVKEVADAFIYATSEGGRFFGMADEQSKTLSGAYNKMSESISFTLASIGQSIATTFDLRGAASHISDLFAQIGNNFETNGQQSRVWSDLLKESLSTIALAIDMAIKGFNAFFDAIKWETISSDLNAFSKWLDDSTIKIAGLFGDEAQKNVKDFIGYLHSFDAGVVGAKAIKPTDIGESIKYMENQIKELNEKMKWQISIDPKAYKESLAQVNKLNKDILILKKTTGRSISSGLGFSATPSKSGENENKAEKNRIQRLIELNKDAALRINEIWLSGTEKKLQTLDNNYKIEIKDFIKYKQDYSNITKRYESERAKIIDDAAKERSVSESNYFNNVLQGLIDTYERIEKAEIARIKNLFSDLQAEVSGIEIAYPKSLNDIFADLTKQDAVGSLEQFGSSIYAAQRDFAMNIAVGFAEIAGATFAGAFNVQDAFKALGSMFTSAIGDLLIKVGTAAIELGLFKEGIETALKSIGGGAGMVALGIAAIAAGSALKSYSGKITDSMSKNKAQTTSSAKSTSSGMTSGASYQYGGASYSTQSLKLSIDLTGAITATQTGYQINKSLETVLRVTGR